MTRANFVKIALLLLACVIVSQGSIYQKYYEEAYQIAAAMTIDQKIGQTIQADFYSFEKKGVTDPSDAIKYHLGSLLVGGNGAPDENGNMVIMPDNQEAKIIEIYANASLQNWQKLTAKFDYSINVTSNSGQTYAIKPLIATDAVHNDQHVPGTILFPHNIGMSCSHNPENFKNIGKWTAVNVKKSGFNYAFAPTVAVSHNPQWGRYYETMGQDHDMIYQYGKSFIEGLQGTPGALTGVLGSVKHFIGDGATLYGADEGNARVSSFKTFLNHNIQGYNGSIAAEVGSVMCSYSGINWLPMAFSPMTSYLLREKLKFDGFIISDYDELQRVIDQQLPTDLQTFYAVNESASLIMNSGIDMMMIPSKGGFLDYIDNTKMILQNGTVTLDRLNDAVARILSVKLALGVATPIKGSKLRKQQFVDPEKISETTEYQDSLQAVHQSLVLLKNQNNLLPVKTSSLEYIVLVGERVININNLAKSELFLNYDDIGMQCGGWSLRWNGFEGNSQWTGDSKTKSNASSIYDALTNLKQGFQLIKPNYTTFTEQIRVDIEREQYLNELKTLRKKMNPSNTLILGIVGEPPYAEFNGDVGIPYCQNETILGKEGCLFDFMQNPYLLQKQRANLDLNYTKFDQEVIDHIRAQDKNIPLLTVILAGRPMIVDKVLQESTALLHAFLPGTSGGQGIIDAVTGSYKLRPQGQQDRRNTLSFDWPRSNEQLQNYPIYRADGKLPSYDNPLFKMGDGLSTA